MLKYRNTTYNNSYWQQQTLEKKNSEKINQRKNGRKVSCLIKSYKTFYDDASIKFEVNTTRDLLPKHLIKT